MIIATNIFHILGGMAEIMVLIICTDLLGIYRKVKFSKYRIVFSLASYIVISIVYIFLDKAFDKSIEFVMAVLYVAKMFFPLLIVYGKINRRIFYLIFFTDLIISFASSCVSCIAANILKTSPNNISSPVTLCTQACALLLLIILRRKADTEKMIIILKVIPKRIFALLLLTVICLSALTSLVTYSTDNYKSKESLLITIIMILSVIMACIIGSLFLNVIGKQHFTAISQMMEKQVELQISHYEKLEKMDAEIRRFRHDYTNHLRSIFSLIQMNELSQAEEYIEKLQTVKYKSGNPMFYTGNKLADALLADKSTTLGESCRIEYSGIIPTSIENVDLCVILSNALDNAAQACRDIHSPCAISISARKQQGYFVMSVRNPTICSQNFYDIPPTTKQEREQHGMGLYNIESTVKKYNGQMKVKCENGVFELMLTLKI